jgi:hypothetical protein
MRILVLERQKYFFNIKYFRFQKDSQRCFFCQIRGCLICESARNNVNKKLQKNFVCGTKSNPNKLNSLPVTLHRYKRGYRFLIPIAIGTGGGKSGQHRAAHRLTAGPGFNREESATENNRPGFNRDKGENVR